jgi:cold shock CspA family protein
VTKGHLLLEDLREKSELLDDVESEDTDIKVRVVDELSRQIELTIQQGMRAFPAEEKLLLLEAEFSKFLRNTPRALRALERAYAKNKDGIYTAIRLARQYFLEHDTKQKAIDLIRKIVSSHQSSKEAHFELAKMLLEVGEAANEKEIEQHLKRSFSTGDTHYEARYLYARHQYLYGNREIGREEFQSLSRVGLQPALMNRVRSEVKDTTGAVVKYQGSINSIHESFAFLRCAQFPGDIFMHFLSMTNRDDWNRLTTGTYVIFSLGFSYKGPAANKVQIKNV